MGKLDGKVALITGAGSGIGRATAILFASEGAKVAVADVVPAGGKETVGAIKGAGGAAIFIECDVSKSSDVQRMIDATISAFGRLDILHNNAAILKLGPVETMDEADWDRLIDINLKSVFLGCKYAIPVMLKQGGGVIINTASAAGIVGIPTMPAYCASKGGVVQITKAMALRYAKDNIRVNCICPGGVDTPMIKAATPQGANMISPEEIARAALFLASNESSSVIGAALAVDRGLTAA